MELEEIAEELREALPAYKTQIHVSDVRVTVKHHNTYIFAYSPHNGLVHLNASWTTATTKKRINACLRVIGCPARVYQKDFRWFLHRDWHERDVELHGATYVFYRDFVYEALAKLSA